MKITAWVVSAFLLAVLTFYAACAAPSTTFSAAAEVEGLPTPFGPLNASSSVSLGKTQHATGSYDSVTGPPQTCVRLQHVMSDGSVVEVDVQTDEFGMGGAPTPPGSVRTNFIVFDCPPEDAGNKVKKMYEPDGLFLAQQPLLASRQLVGNVYEVYSMPSELQVFSGGTDIEYAMHIKADSPEEAQALADSIVPGSPIPENVVVGYWRSYSKVEHGVVRMIAAQPGTFEQWTLNVNAGAHVADLWTNSTRYSFGGWDVIETVIPANALNFGIPGSGQDVDNQFAIEHKTDLLEVPVTCSLKLTFHY